MPHTFQLSTGPLTLTFKYRTYANGYTGIIATGPQGLYARLSLNVIGVNPPLEEGAYWSNPTEELEEIWPELLSRRLVELTGRRLQSGSVLLEAFRPLPELFNPKE